MKILIIRHGDPDYKQDSLTEKGRREAECLSDLICEIDSENTHYYVSPYGRAKETAEIALSRTGRTAVILPWLREFDVRIQRPDDPLKEPYCMGLAAAGLDKGSEAIPEGPLDGE